MSYKKAAHLLPADLLKEVQKYVDGTCIYIPRADAHKRSWGAETSIRRELNERNLRIYHDYLGGCSTELLAQNYYLSQKSIQRIIRQQRTCDNK